MRPVQVSIVPVALVECIIVSLGFHIEPFNFPFTPVLRGPICKVFVGKHVSEFVEF